MIDGKETGQTMATPAHRCLSLIDDHPDAGKAVRHVQSGALPDGKTLTVENDMSAPDPSVGKQTEYWDRR